MIYRIILTCFTAAILSSTLLAQFTPEQRIEDSVIGWWDNLKYDKKLTAENNPDRKKKIGHLDKLVEWMKKSYTPVGGTGTYTRYINTSSWGVQFAVWNVSFNKEWLDPKGKFRPIPEELTKFGIQVNGIPGSYPISFINTPEQYLFTWQPDGFVPSEEIKQKRKQLDPKIDANAYPYLTHINDLVTVYLAPGNKLPFIPVSRGEVLNLAETALERQLENEKKDVEQKWPGNLKAQQDAFAYRKTEIDKYRSNIQQLRKKYTGSLSEPAVLRDMQPGFRSFSLDPDPFLITVLEKKRNAFYPVYKLTRDVMEKCKASQPQWIAFWVPFETKEDGNQLVEMYRSMTRHMNFEYIYNYFFDPGKNEGLPYEPANKTELSTRLENYRKKAHHANPLSQQQLLPGEFFKDNFASNSIGNRPTGWYFRTFGEHATIASINGKPGKWLKPGYASDIQPMWLKKPIPENFNLEFDLVTDDFISRTGGAIRLHLSSYPLSEDGREQTNQPGNSLDLTLIAGNENDFTNNNFMGETRLEVHSNPALFKENFTEGLFFKEATRHFTNRKNRIHVKLEVKNGEISLFQQDKKISTQSDLKLSYGKECTGCKLPAGTRFTNLYFRNITNEPGLTGIYLSNILISSL